jgi:hypothetical protein
LKKRTSINSIPRIHKEKEMADFRKWFYALAVVALLAGLTVPASAQSTAVSCTNAGGVTPTVRSQGLTELMGDLVVQCTGGTPTAAGAVVPQVNFTVILSTNITSKLLSSNGLFNEALMIIDEPNAPGPNSNRPILNCGNAGAPDSSVESGPGVCSIISTGVPANTYDGTSNGFGPPAGTCGVGAAPAVGTYGCGRPNVFQGRQGSPFNTGQANTISFLNVPIDPPGTGTTRTIRVTNVRGNANLVGIASTFTQIPITMQLSINGNTSLAINLPATGQVVAFVQTGLIVTVINSNLGFVQCNTENGKLFGGSAFPFNPLGTAGGAGGGNTNSGAGPPTVRFAEGFASSWKVKNIAQTLANGSAPSVLGEGYVYNGGLLYPVDVNQNVPGAIYNTETGFQYSPSFTQPTPNPPVGVGTTAVTGTANTPQPFADAAGTGIGGAGGATAGTRLEMTFTNIPQGSSIFVPPVIFLYRQNTTPPLPAIYTAGVSTGVAVLTTTDANGDTTYAPAETGLPSSIPAVASGNPVGTLSPVSNGLAVYEVLFDDPGSLEQVDIPVVVAFVSNLSANPPIGLPATGTIAQVAGGFAPFYTTSAAGLPSGSLPIPRFTPGNAPLNLFEVNKCACDLLFPFVTSTGGFDTGIAIANTSLDPGATFGFGATPQQGAVTFFYFGTGAGGAAPPASQTSGIVPAGQILTYVVSSGGGSIGTSANGLDNRGAGFQGYIIAQAAFQWCHAYAFIGALGQGPGTPGVSEGYLGLILDLGGLHRTGQASENLVH